MNIAFRLLITLILLITAMQISTIYASENGIDKHQAAIKDKALTTSDSFNDDKNTKKNEDSLKDEINALDRVLFLAKRKFGIKEDDYIVILGDMTECIKLEYKLKSESISEKEKQSIIAESIQKCEADTKLILKKNYADFIQFMTDNAYEKTFGWDNVEKANGIQISILGIVYVFIGLAMLVLILNIFSRVFAKKEPAEQVITIEMDDSPVRGSSTRISTRTSSTILIRKDLLKREKEQALVRAEAKKAKEEAERLFKEREQEMKEISAAIAMAIHAELHLYAKSEQLTVLDYPNIVSSWAFSTRPVLNVYNQRLNKR
ncbi:MAG: OadG family protein [Planctomycetes bacterium]|nr:OadG family protein [Planctomycetota bacterium]